MIERAEEISSFFLPFFIKVYNFKKSYLLLSNSVLLLNYGNRLQIKNKENIP